MRRENNGSKERQAIASRKYQWRVYVYRALEVLVPSGSTEIQMRIDRWSDELFSASGPRVRAHKR